MELRRLNHFVAVATELNFGRAAQHLFMTQPGLSQSIKTLERELGLLLFERSHQHVRLTAAGRALLPRVRELLAHAEETTRFAKHLADSHKDSLTISNTRSAGVGLPSTLIAAFRDTRPEVEIHTAIGFTSINVDRVRLREVDAAFVRPPVDTCDELDLAILASDAVLVAVPTDHHLSDRPYLNSMDLVGESLVYFPQDAGGLWQALLDAVYGPEQYPSICRVEPDEPQMLAAVSGGAGISLLTEPAATLYNVPGVVVKPLQKKPTVPIGLTWRKDNINPALKDFLAFVSDPGHAGEVHDGIGPE